MLVGEEVLQQTGTLDRLLLEGATLGHESWDHCKQPPSPRASLCLCSQATSVPCHPPGPRQWQRPSIPPPAPPLGLGHGCHVAWGSQMPETCTKALRGLARTLHAGKLLVSGELPTACRSGAFIMHTKRRHNQFPSWHSALNTHFFSLIAGLN